MAYKSSIKAIFLLLAFNAIMFCSQDNSAPDSKKYISSPDPVPSDIRTLRTSFFDKFIGANFPSLESLDPAAPATVTFVDRPRMEELPVSQVDVVLVGSVVGVQPYFYTRHNAEHF